MNKSDAIKTMLNETNLLNNFLSYVKVDTQSNPESKTHPTTEIQKNLGKQLVEELKKLGLTDASIDKYSYVYAHLPANNGSKTKVGLIAHLDVSSDCKGNGVKPVLHKNYDGKDIKLSKDVTITVEDSPTLKECVGHTIITSDGSTLLGADDKAGIASIMSMLEYIQKHPEVKHPQLSICFTPDEEVGQGVDYIDLEKLDADFAYTVDGEFPPEVNFENFNAFSAKITITGISHHPGFAKGKLVNSMKYTGKFLEMLPQNMAPETTDEKQGFIHPVSIKGSSEETTVEAILRSFDIDEIEKEKQIIKDIVDKLKREEPRLKINLEFKETYLNMLEVMKDHKDVVDYIKEAMNELGFEPDFQAIRGGTDGARLSFMGVPCPNIFDGGVNFHSVREWVSLENIALSAAVILQLIQKIK
jgi:tripeptide aminopeptidase